MLSINVCTRYVRSMKMTPSELWHSLHEWRWHKNPDLRHINDDFMAHSARMGVLAMRLWPDDQQLVCDCLKHDLGETAGGDMDGEFKRNNPGLKALLDIAETDQVRRMGFTPAQPDPRMDILDKLDAYLTARLHAPHIMGREDWQTAREAIKRNITAHVRDHQTAVALLGMLGGADA